MKIFCLAPNEDWVCDRFAKEWFAMNNDIATNDPEKADIIWLLADWCWNHIPAKMLSEKKVVCTVHHLVPQKFNYSKRENFLERDKFVDMYHVPSMKTRDQVDSLTSKPIIYHPFWVNQGIWTKIANKNAVRTKYNLPNDAYIVGSFQRDTERSDLITPKLEKGPDIFVKYLKKLRDEDKNVHVLLAGWRRQFVIGELRSENIPYTYIELPEFSVLNELYNCLDLYVVGSRYEGGPQAIFECAATETPIVSTDVGSATEILDGCSIFDLNDIKLAFPNTQYARLRV
jgi:glycosyltransferase involved in cell wall biosynthesis